jgi:NAD(P)-dependent dehydrogenase (short-subunit alcohol dehydrogenase family)
MIVLSGASGGIGRAILPSLATLDEVVALYHRGTPPPEGGRIRTAKVDLSSESEVHRFVGSLAPEGRITLVHGAGVKVDGLAADVHIEDWKKTLDANLTASFLLTQAFLRPMMAEKWGRIVFMSSVAASRGASGALAYSASKAGLVGMSRTLAIEYGRFGITSNVLQLGYFEAGMMERFAEEELKRMRDQIPSRKLGRPVNLFHAIRFLIDSEFTNGATIAMDGGI